MADTFVSFRDQALIELIDTTRRQVEEEQEARIETLLNSSDCFSRFEDTYTDIYCDACSRDICPGQHYWFRAGDLCQEHLCESCNLEFSFDQSDACLDGIPAHFCVNEFLPECFTCHQPVKKHYYQLLFRTLGDQTYDVCCADHIFTRVPGCRGSKETPRVTEQSVYEFSENKIKDDETRNKYAEMIVDRFGYIKRANEHVSKGLLGDRKAQPEGDYDPEFPEYNANVGKN